MVLEVFIAVDRGATGAGRGGRKCWGGEEEKEEEEEEDTSAREIATTRPRGAHLST